LDGFDGAGRRRQGQASAALGDPGLYGRLGGLGHCLPQPPAPAAPSTPLDAEFGL